jgi:prepilin-type N-terminal cleavage/methylation domain-containing protein
MNQTNNQNPMKNNPKHSEIIRKYFPSKHGFTLVELLVCIAIIATLAVVAFFFTGKARSKAMQVNALGMLREVATANAGFATENSGKINTMRWVGDPEEGKPYVGNSFWGRMEPYLFSGAGSTNQPQLAAELKLRLKQFLATADTSKMTGTLLQGSRIYHDASGLPIPFSFNGKLYSWGKWARLSQISDPARVMYATYGFAFVTEANSKIYQERPTDGTSKPIYFMDNKKALVVFIDGHTESVSAPFPDTMFE